AGFGKPGRDAGHDAPGAGDGPPAGAAPALERPGATASPAARARSGGRRAGQCRARYRLAVADEPAESDGRQRAPESLEEGEGDAELNRAQCRRAGPDDRPDLADVDHVRRPG